MASDTVYHRFATNNIGNGTHKTSQTDKEEVTVAIYVRVSSPGQVIYGYSLEEQVRLCRERCDMMGWEVRYIFRENGESAKTTDRPKFQLMLERAREGAFHVLVFWKLDRFCRSLADVVNIERELGGCGISLYSITEQIDTITPVGKFNFRNLASASELERDFISERVRMGITAMARQHKWVTNYPPLGYDKGEDGRLVKNNAEAKLVREIFEMYINLESMPQVAFELNKNGVKTKWNKKWSTYSVKKILDSRIYLGEYETAGVKDHVEDYRILEEELFNKALKLRCKAKKVRKPMPTSRKEATIDKIFEDYFSLLREEEAEEF